MNALQKLQPGIAQTFVPSDALRPRTDAQLGIDEIEVLRLDTDMVAPPEAVSIAEPVVDAFRGELRSGDELRLGVMARLDRETTRSALDRMLARDRSALTGSHEAVEREARMLEVLEAYAEQARAIEERARIEIRADR